MKIVVLGASGRTVRLVVEQALARGDVVVAYVRNPQAIAAIPGLEIAVAQLDNMRALKSATAPPMQRFSASARTGRG